MSSSEESSDIDDFDSFIQDVVKTVNKSPGKARGSRDGASKGPADAPSSSKRVAGGKGGGSTSRAPSASDSKGSLASADSSPGLQAAGLTKEKVKGGMLDLSVISPKAKGKSSKEWRVRSDPLIGSTDKGGAAGDGDDDLAEADVDRPSRRTKLVRSASGSGKNLRQMALGMHQAMSSQWSLTAADKLTGFPELSANELMPLAFDIALTRLSASSRVLPSAVYSALFSALEPLYRELGAKPPPTAAHVGGSLKAKRPSAECTQGTIFEASKLAQTVARLTEHLESMALAPTPRQSKNRGRNNLNIEVSSFSDQGKRSYMEDESAVLTHAGLLYNLSQRSSLAAFGVFDGHRGKLAAMYARAMLLYSIIHNENFSKDPKKAHLEAYELVNTMYNEKANKLGSKSGTTALCCFIEPSVTPALPLSPLLTLHLSGVGDTEAILCHNETAVCLSTKHTPKMKSEQDRIKAAGGSVDFVMGAWRVNGALSVARSIGDPHVDQFLIATPFYATRTLGPGDRFLIMATDGVFDVMSHQDAVDCVLAHLAAQKPPSSAAESLVRAALERKAEDNCTCVVVFFTDREANGGAHTNDLRAHSEVFR